MFFFIVMFCFWDFFFLQMEVKLDRSEFIWSCFCFVFVSSSFCMISLVVSCRLWNVWLNLDARVCVCPCVSKRWFGAQQTLFFTRRQDFGSLITNSFGPVVFTNEKLIYWYPVCIQRPGCSNRAIGLKILFKPKKFQISWFCLFVCLFSYLIREYLFTLLWL